MRDRNKRNRRQLVGGFSLQRKRVGLLLFDALSGSEWWGGGMICCVCFCMADVGSRVGEMGETSRHFVEETRV